MRLDKLLADSGLLSRKEAGNAVKRGYVTVNGTKVSSSSLHIDPEKDEVLLRGEKILYRPFTYVMLNKPAGYISATEDGKLPVVTSLLSEERQRIGLFPSGRLDRDTVGLMILTNDGVLSHKLLSPRRHAEKVYYFEAEAPLLPEAEALFSAGMVIGGERCKPALLSADEGRRCGTVTLTEGKYHQIKRMFLSVGNRITFLKRLSFAGVSLDPALKPGEYRLLTEQEIDALRASV